MANFAYGKDILLDVLFRASESVALTGDTSDYLTAVKSYIQRAYDYVLCHYPWPFSLKDPPGIINTVAAEEINVNVTEGSASITLQALASGSLVGYKMYVEGDDTRYRVIIHTGGTFNATLDATWKSDTGSGLGVFYKDEYSIAADCLKPWAFKKRDDPEAEFDFESGRDVWRRPPAIEVDNVKYKVSWIRSDKILIYPYFDSAITIEYEYTYKPSALTFDEATADVLIIPRPFAPVLSDVALYMLYEDKNEPRAGIIKQDMDKSLNRMTDWYAGVSKPRLKPKHKDAIGKVR